MDFILEERVEKARDLFRQGYNCSQSVFLAYNDLLGVESTLAATISGPLGGGMGRLREVCGAVSGMSLIAGFPRTLPRSGRPAGQSRDLRARTGVRRAVPRRERCDRLPRTAGARLPQGGTRACGTDGRILQKAPLRRTRRLCGPYCGGVPATAERCAGRVAAGARPTASAVVPRYVTDSAAISSLPARAACIPPGNRAIQNARRAMFLPLRRADKSSRCPNNRRTPDLSFDTGSNRSHTETAPENRDNRSCRISCSAARCIVR